MKYEEWIRYEQQREAQPDIFGWVTVPELPSNQELNTPLANEVVPPDKRKKFFGKLRANKAHLRHQIKPKSKNESLSADQSQHLA